MTTLDIKRELRVQMKEKRSLLELQAHRRMSMDIMYRCMDLTEWKQAKTVHIYVSCVNNEVDTLGLIYSLFDNMVRVVVPKCTSEPCQLVHLQLASMDDLKPSRHCLMEPVYSEDRLVAPHELDLVVAPVVAFDRSGGRLGMGGGYYDTFLRYCECVKVGLAFGFQEVPEVPKEPHDTELDMILTELETIRIANE